MHDFIHSYYEWNFPLFLTCHCTTDEEQWVVGASAPKLYASYSQGSIICVVVITSVLYLDVPETAREKGWYVQTKNDHPKTIGRSPCVSVSEAVIVLMAVVDEQGLGRMQLRLEAKPFLITAVLGRRCAVLVSGCHV